MNIRVHGEGCYRCLQLEMLVGQVLTELGVEADLVRIDNPREFSRYTLAGPPGLIIDGKLIVEGRLPSRLEVSHWILAAHKWEQRGEAL